MTVGQGLETCMGKATSKTAVVLSAVTPRYVHGSVGNRHAIVF